VQPAIVVERVGKQFRRYHADRPRTLKEAVVRRFRHLRVAERFWALRDISFAVEPGQVVGIVGRNGAGKSTLLRLIGGVGRPDEGGVKVNGRVTGLLELGSGFQPELTGRENLFISAIVSGLTRRQVTRRLDAIVEFAELEPFIDSPVRTYSTGMQMRLAFAIGIHTSPRVLLIDEVLAVGDVSFQEKCLERIRQFRSDHCSIVLVTHNTDEVRQLCDSALWLRGGRLVAHGDPDRVVTDYLAEFAAETRRHTPQDWPVRATGTGKELRVHENRFGSMDMEITRVRLLDGRGHPLSKFTSGDGLRVDIEYCAPQRVEAPIFGVKITTEDGQVCTDLSTASAGVTLPALQGRGRIALQFERLDLNGGRHFVDVGAYPGDWAHAYDYHWHVYPLQVSPTAATHGLLHPPHRWELDGARVIRFRQR